MIPHLYHRAACALLGIRIERVGAPADGRPLLLAANHSSWLDITVLAAAMPVAFVAKSEIAGWPGIGTLAKLSRTIFVDRTRKTATRATAREMAARLSAGEPIVLFAEGTSSDHNRVLPFRSALIGAAHEAIAAAGAGQALVQPVSVAYPSRHGLPLLRSERPQIAWYGGMTLPKHLWDMLRTGGPRAVISFGAPIPVTAASDRKAVARAAEAEVRAMTRRALRYPPSEPGRRSVPAGLTPSPDAPDEVGILLDAQTG